MNTKAKYAFALLVILLLLVAALITGLLVSGRTAEAMRVVDGVAWFLGVGGGLGLIVYAVIHDPTD